MGGEDNPQGFMSGPGQCDTAGDSAPLPKHSTVDPTGISHSALCALATNELNLLKFYCWFIIGFHLNG